MDRTYATMERVLSGVTYKPGYAFQLRRQEFIGKDAIILRIVMQGPSSEPFVLDPVRISMEALVEYPLLNSEAVLAWLFDLVTRFEDHEMREWFRVDGRHYKDPHPERRPPGDRIELRYENEPAQPYSNPLMGALPRGVRGITS